MPSTVSLEDKKTYLDNLLAHMTVEELAFQLPLMSGNWVVGEKSDHEGLAKLLHLAPDAGLGAICDWYPTSPSQYNALQALNLSTSRLRIPFISMGECLHSVFSNRQSVFPQALSLSSSFDLDLVKRVGRALGAEARAIGIHANFSPVLDIAKEPRYGRSQETFGEDYVLVSHMGVAYTQGLSKDGAIADNDATPAVIKHFAGHGAPQGGLHSNAWSGRGRRELLTEVLPPFKAAIEQGEGGVRGVMMSYTAVDDIPAHLDPFLYDRLEEWGYDGFVISDWCGLEEQVTGHLTAKSPIDAIRQWLNAGGGIFLYDFTPDIIVSSIAELAKNGEVDLATLQERVRKVLEVKYDLGLFQNPYMDDDIESQEFTLNHIPLALEAAQKSIFLLENRNSTLPLRLSEKGIKKIAVVGPFADNFNFGSYSGTWGANPTDRASTIRQGIIEHLAQSGEGDVKVFSAWGANSWTYNAQYPIPGYLLSANGSPGGLQATYYQDSDFKKEAYKVVETPNRDWGLYPPVGIESTSFGVVWEGQLDVPVSSPVHGSLGVAVLPKTFARLYIDGKLVYQTEEGSGTTILREIMPYTFSTEHGTELPPGGRDFVFRPGCKHQIRVECEVHPNWPRTSAAGVHSRVQLWWNLVDRKDAVGQATQVASHADVIVLAVGAAWNSDGENGDRADLGLSPDQTRLARGIFSLGKPVVLVLEGGRPFAIPEFYAQSAAVLSSGFLGQASGRAIADVLFGNFNPGGRLTMSVPYDAGALPVNYNQRTTKDLAHIPYYLDIPKPAIYSFGYGLSYTTFSQELQGAEPIEGECNGTFAHGGTIKFTVSVRNTGTVAGSHVPQIYLLRREGSSVTTANKQLVAFTRLHIEPRQTKTATMDLEVDRFLPVINRSYERVLETGEYKFALMDDGSPEAPAIGEVMLTVRESFKYDKY
ncbi:uncharacterized protein LDX57_008384 [Aspergillus melleus]|uniref:uncharacterized protein n=1 Tax=Aspergillus melleus TaxID=138277 RepID=UPI001E8DEA7C|nr:uncharacterized protein LDX57_008384 [Aspergillus melleus]KAH8430722.1 hypothetical protein LDX57_008384 [Aspergillus melleus]